MKWLFKKIERTNFINFSEFIKKLTLRIKFNVSQIKRKIYLCYKCKALKFNLSYRICGDKKYKNNIKISITLKWQNKNNVI